MSAHSAPALDACVLQLAALLEGYEQDVRTMVDTWLDMDVYRRVSAEVEDIRMYCGNLPQLSVAWAELLIAHAELVHSLWRLRFRDADADRGVFQEVVARHGACVRSLRARCLRLLGRQG